MSTYIAHVYFTPSLCSKTNHDQCNNFGVNMIGDANGYRICSADGSN